MLLLISAAVAFESFAFIEGQWCAEALGGQVVERWEAPFGNAMSGSMTLVRDGNVAFHEFFVLAESESGWEIRLKHFNPDMSSWEEKGAPMVFPLLRASRGRLEFEGMTISQRAPGVSMDVTVDSADGRELVFNYRKCE